MSQLIRTDHFCSSTILIWRCRRNSRARSHTGSLVTILQLRYYHLFDPVPRSNYSKQNPTKQGKRAWGCFSLVALCFNWARCGRHVQCVRCRQREKLVSGSSHAVTPAPPPGVLGMQCHLNRWCHTRVAVLNIAFLNTTYKTASIMWNTHRVNIYCHLLQYARGQTCLSCDQQIYKMKSSQSIISS